MPTYEYQCGKCGVFELSQRISDAALTKCPTCRRKVQRLISASNFAFKGSGWYVTDYARKGKDNGKSSESSGSESGGGESKSETKTETSSESKSESKSTKKAKAGSSSSEKSSS